jgi:predicted acetyltransferase
MTVSGYVLEEAGQVGGYVFLGRVRPPGEDFLFELVLTDLIARSARGWQRLLTFLADHGSMALEVKWFGGLDDPLVHLFREQAVSTRVLFHWMIRLLDVPAALAGRGFPRGLSAALHLEVEDPLFAENAGRWVVEVKGGEARVERGGEGHLRCDVRALATLYSGHRSASTLATLGVLQGTPEALELADALFAGHPPSMPDMY